MVVGPQQCSLTEIPLHYISLLSNWPKSGGLKITTDFNKPNTDFETEDSVKRAMETCEKEIEIDGTIYTRMDQS